MADLNKFQRSKERLTEVLNHLLYRSANDERTNSFIKELRRSIKIIEGKMEEFKRNDFIGS